MLYRFAVFVTLIVANPFLTRADWPAFRGPTNNGISTEQDLPLTWSQQENIKWKSPLPQPGNGSPIVVAGRVFVCSAQDAQGKQRSLYCFDAATGEQQWVRTVDFDKAMPTHATNPYAGSTPVSDGTRVVVWHASAGLFCYDLDGHEQWSRDLGEFKHIWGYGSSPILYKDRVILFTGPGAKSFITAIELTGGKTIWQTDEPGEGDGSFNDAKKWMGSWSTPVVTKVNGREQIIAMLPTRVNAYDPDSGEIIWTCDGLRHDRGDLAYSSPVIAGDVCFVTGGFNGVSMAIELGGEGNITESHRLWRKENNPQSIGSGVFVGGHVYRPNADGGTIECFEPKSGKALWRARADGGAFWGSMVLAAGRVYVTSQHGTTIVFEPSPVEYKELAANKLGDTCNTTPALADGQIYIRTHKHLYCIRD
jgi:outer membrane protein assembly factor BamB